MVYVYAIKIHTDQTKFLYWAKLVFRVTRLQLSAGLVIPVNQADYHTYKTFV